MITIYLYYHYDNLKRNQIFIKFEKYNLSSGAYHNDLFCNFQKTFEILEKTERYTPLLKIELKKYEYSSVSISALLI
jgi:hypothetical protein